MKTMQIVGDKQGQVKVSENNASGYHSQAINSDFNLLLVEEFKKLKRKERKDKIIFSIKHPIQSLRNELKSFRLNRNIKIELTVPDSYENYDYDSETTQKLPVKTDIQKKGE